MNSSPLTSSIRGGSSEMLFARIAPRLPAIVTWVLGILLGVQAALIVRDLIPQPAPSAVIAPPAEGTVRRTVNVQNILGAHLFGLAEAPDASASDPADAPQTSLTLVLAGTIASSDPKVGFGIIGETAQAGKVYSVGDSIAGGGAKLHAVYTDRVILDRSGQLEALMLPRKTEGGAASVRTSAAPLNRADGAPGGGLADRVRRMIAQDPGSVAEVMRPQAVFANGVQRGYRVYPGRNRQAFAKLGLRPGDLVMAVNGTPLDDPARGMEIFRSIGSADSVRVVIERSGRPQELVLNMTQLANQAQELTEGDGMVPVDQTPPMPEPPIEE